MNSSRWDIFCSVVDNYGDAGVAWASRAPARGRAWHRREALCRRPSRTGAVGSGRGIARRVGRGDDLALDGVQILRWTGGADAPAPDRVANVVIDTFGCGVPNAYASAMAERSPSPPWIILEYLSAEILDRHSSRPRLAPSHASLAALFLLSGIHRGDGRPPARAWASRATRCVSVGRGRAGRIPALARHRQAFARCDGCIALLLSRCAGGLAARCVGRRRCAGPLHRAGGAWRRERSIAGRTASYRTRAIRWHGAGSSSREYRTFPRMITIFCFGRRTSISCAERIRSFARNGQRGPLVWNSYAQADNAHALKQEAFLERYGGRAAPAAANAHASFTRAWNDPGQGCGSLG